MAGKLTNVKAGLSVKRLEQLTSSTLQDLDLSQVTIADPTGIGLSMAVVMASRAFCVNTVCGPQVEALQALKNELKVSL